MSQTETRADLLRRLLDHPERARRMQGVELLEALHASGVTLTGDLQGAWAVHAMIRWVRAFRGEPMAVDEPMPPPFTPAEVQSAVEWLDGSPIPGLRRRRLPVAVQISVTPISGSANVEIIIRRDLGGSDIVYVFTLRGPPERVEHCEVRLEYRN